MKNKNSGMRNIITITIGELIVSSCTVAVFALLGSFSYKVITGVLLGSLVAILNFVFLSVSINRAVDKFMELRGEREMDEDEADAFAAKHNAEISNASRLSYIIRTFTMLGALVAAFISEQFDAVATVIPLLAFQPILIVAETLRRKRGD